MKIKDKRFKKMVDVANPECQQYACYWARADPGSFTQGQGYKFRSNDWLCGNREIRGCPNEPKLRKATNEK